MSKPVFWRLKCSGFVSVTEEFPAVPDDWYPGCSGVETCFNASGVALSEVPVLAWLHRVPHTRRLFQTYVNTMEAEAYEGAGDLHQTYKEFKHLFPLEKGEEESDTDEDSEPEAEPVAAVAETEPVAAVTVTEPVAAVTVTEPVAAVSEPMAVASVNEEVDEELTQKYTEEEEEEEEVQFVRVEGGRKREAEVMFLSSTCKRICTE